MRTAARSLTNCRKDPSNELRRNSLSFRRCRAHLEQEEWRWRSFHQKLSFVRFYGFQLSNDSFAHIFWKGVSFIDVWIPVDSDQHETKLFFNLLKQISCIWRIFAGSWEGQKMGKQHVHLWIIRFALLLFLWQLIYDNEYSVWHEQFAKVGREPLSKQTSCYGMARWLAIHSRLRYFGMKRHRRQAIMTTYQLWIISPYSSQSTAYPIFI